MSSKHLRGAARHPVGTLRREEALNRFLAEVEQRARLATGAKRWRDLSPEEREPARERYREFRELSPEERERQRLRHRHRPRDRRQQYSG